MHEGHDGSGEGGFVSVGAVAQAVGLCPQSIRNLERRGTIPRANRLDPGRRRVWRVADIEAIRVQIEQQRAKRGDRVTVAS